MNSQIKILHIVGTMNRGGAELMLLDIAKNISAKYKLIFLVNYKDKNCKYGLLDQELLDLGCDIYYIKTQWTSGLIKYYISFKNILKKTGQVDVIHSHINVKSGFVSFCAKILNIKKIIVHSHGEINYWNKKFKSIVLNTEFIFQKILIHSFATDFWACSLKAGKTLFPHKKDKEIVVIKNAINIDPYQNILASEIHSIRNDFTSQPKLIIGSVGRVVKRKNLSFIIDVLHELKKNKIDFVFVNIGQIDDNEYFEQVKHKINKYDLCKDVIHLGLREDIPLLMSSLDVFISPAFNEAFGIVAIEAQAAGVKTVLSNQFPTEVDLGLGLVDFIGVFDPKIWMNTILVGKTMPAINNKLIRQTFQEKGFDIKKNITTIEHFYEN